MVSWVWLLIEASFFFGCMSAMAFHMRSQLRKLRRDYIEWAETYGGGRAWWEKGKP